MVVCCFSLWKQYGFSSRAMRPRLDILTPIREIETIFAIKPLKAIFVSMKKAESLLLSVEEMAQTQMLGERLA